MPPAEEVQDEVNKEEQDKVLVSPPPWNAWYSSCCHVPHYIDDGGALEGKCDMCVNIRPKGQDIMLDPDQLAELKKSPCLSFDTLMVGNTCFHSPSPPELPASNPRGQVRKSPNFFEEMGWGKMSGLTDDTSFMITKLRGLISKWYLLFEPHHHYMEHVPIGKENHGTLELAIMVETGSIVRQGLLLGRWR